MHHYGYDNPEGGSYESQSFTYGFRPIFILNDNVKIVGGNGSSEPYKLGI